LCTPLCPVGRGTGSAVGLALGVAVGAGVVTAGTLVGVPPVVSGCATATAGARVGRGVGGGGGAGLLDGSTDGATVGATVGVGVGGLVGGVDAGAVVAWPGPGVDDGGWPLGFGAVVGPPGVPAGPAGVGEAKAIPGVCPLPVEGAMVTPENPTPSASAARTTLTKPSARTSRRR
jgi:hypothetical protein